MTLGRMFEEAAPPASRSARRWSGAIVSVAASLLLGCGGGGHGTMMAHSPDGGGGAGNPGGGGAGGGRADGGSDAGADAIVADAAAPDSGANDAPVRINVTVDHCPTVLAAASPSMTSVGKSVDVDATGDDADGDVLTYLWSAPSGTFASPAAASTTYTCANSGVVMLTVTVSDHRCDGQAAVPFTCLPSP